jgi:hypothetical protein
VSIFHVRGYRSKMVDSILPHPLPFRVNLQDEPLSNSRIIV